MYTPCAEESKLNYFYNNFIVAKGAAVGGSVSLGLIPTGTVPNESLVAGSKGIRTKLLPCASKSLPRYLVRRIWALKGSRESMTLNSDGQTFKKVVN